MDKNNTIYKILEYYYLNDLSQSEIAAKLNLTRVSVSRHISRAKKKGLIEFRIKYPANYNIDRHEKLEKEFKKWYKLKECVIVNSFHDYMDTIKSISKHLSNILEKIVNCNVFIGVGWGTTLDKIVQTLEVKENRNVKVFPMVGGYGKYFDDMHSNNIARMLAGKYKGSSYVINIPAAFDTKEIKDVMLRDSAAREIFKLSKRADIALLCMSDLSTRSTLYNKGQIDQEDIDYLSSLGVIGDINYIFVDKCGKFVPNEISDRIATIFPVELMKLTKNVIGIAIGERKAQIIRAVLKAGLINILFTDFDAASNVIKIE